MSAAGAVLGTPTTLPGFSSELLELAVASDGTSFLVAATDYSPMLRWTVVSAAGIAGPTQSLTLPAAAHQPTVDYDGTSYVVAWIDARDGLRRVRGGRISPTGQFLDGTGVDLSPALTGTTNHGIPPPGDL